MQCVRCLIVLIFISKSKGTSLTQERNVCNNWSDYGDDNMQNNPDCFYNEDVGLDVPELLRKYFGYYETHEIPTIDGYFVTVFRVPRKNSKGTIMFRHPASADSSIWILLGKESQAYYFWKNGYDIWMTNSRGSVFSRKHVNLTDQDYKYWNFSFHEIAEYDLRASMKYIFRKNKNRRIIVIAHSMGSTESLIYASMFPAEAKKYAKIFILMAPATSFKYSKIKIVAELVPSFQEYTKKEKIGGIFEMNSTITRTMRNTCSPKLLELCAGAITSVGAGNSVGEAMPVIAPLMFAHYPRPLSVKTLLHYGQFMTSGKFQMFDYNEKNIEVYGSTKPPVYPVSKISVPTYLVYSPQDIFAPIEDTEELYSKLSEKAKFYGKLMVDKMDHVDFLTGKNRVEKIYSKILNLLEKIYFDNVS